MAIEKKRMQQRYGTYQQFQDNINNLLPNEFASVVSDDPNTDSGEGLYFQCGSNTPKRILTEEDKSLPVVTVIDINSDNDHIPTALAVYNYAAPKAAVNNINTEIQHIEDSLGDKLEESDVEEILADKNFEEKSNRVNAIGGNGRTPDNNHYPTEKAVYDYAVSIGNYNALEYQFVQLRNTVNNLPTTSEVQQMIDDSIAEIPRAEEVLYGN